MTIKIGGLGQEISCYCPICSEKMTHMCVATLGTGKTIRYEWQCNACELYLKSDRDGNAKMLKEMELIK